MINRQLLSPTHTHICVWILLYILILSFKVLLCPTFCDAMNYTVHGILQARILGWVAFPFFRDLPNPGIKSRSPTFQEDSLTAEPQGKPKNTGVGSISLLQQIFSTQELNQGFLHHRQILYQLSYQGPLLLLIIFFQNGFYDLKVKHCYNIFQLVSNISQILFSQNA